MPTDLAALLAAVEQAWNSTTGHPGTWADVAEEIEAMLAALRATRDSGYAVALVSREAVEALRVSHLSIFNAEEACNLLARDLSALLKETK
jgi:hypothetical protein